MQHEILRIEEGVRLKQLERLQRVKSQRSNQAVEAAIGQLKTAARESRNVLPPILAAVEVYATIGEISDALRSVWGEYEG